MPLYDQIARGFNPLAGLESSAKIGLQGQQLKYKQDQDQQLAEQKSLFNQLKLAETMRVNDSTINKKTIAANKQAFDMQSSILGNVKSPAQFEAAKIRLNQVGVPLPEGVTFDNVGSYTVQKAAEFGTNVHYGKIGDKNIAYQVSKDGAVKVINLPGGATPTKPISFQNLGGQIVGKDPITGADVVVDNKTLPPEKKLGYVQDAEDIKKGTELKFNLRKNLPKARQAFNVLKIKHAHRSSLIAEARSLIGPGTVGYGAALKLLPAGKARRLDKIFMTLRAQAGFEELQMMRQFSPTGGSLGQVSDKENEFLQALRGSLDQLQNEADLNRVLDDYLNMSNMFVTSAQSDINDMQGQISGNKTSEQPTENQKNIPIYNPETGEFE
ncbi:MAG: hypothetical protein KZQ94_15920 [Candidatus Thiodiazotropha sp. (ex Troendleina suluensis)]|nr:hypothetical protein [Candidatus Thiodiazotropha sp. (ex Troendleina suluensis)]